MEDYKKDVSVHEESIVQCHNNNSPSSTKLKGILDAFEDFEITRASAGHVLGTRDPTLGLIMDFGDHRQLFCQPLSRELETLVVFICTLICLYNSSNAQPPAFR